MASSSTFGGYISYALDAKDLAGVIKTHLGKYDVRCVSLQDANGAANQAGILEDMKKTKNFICILSAEYISSLHEDANETSFGKREALAALTQKMNIIPIIPKGGRYPGKQTVDKLNPNLQDLFKPMAIQFYAEGEHNTVFFKELFDRMCCEMKTEDRLAAATVTTELQEWLSRLHLQEYIVKFGQLGIRTRADLQALTPSDLDTLQLRRFDQMKLVSALRTLPVPTTTPAEEVNDCELVVAWLKSLKIREEDAKVYAGELDNEGYDCLDAMADLKEQYPSPKDLTQRFKFKEGHCIRILRGCESAHLKTFLPSNSTPPGMGAAVGSEGGNSSMAGGDLGAAGSSIFSMGGYVNYWQPRPEVAADPEELIRRAVTGREAPVALVQLMADFIHDKTIQRLASDELTKLMLTKYDFKPNLVVVGNNIKKTQRNAVVAAGAIEANVSMMLNHIDDIDCCLAATRVFKCISVDCEENKNICEKVIDARGIQAVIAIMRRYPTEESIQRMATRAYAFLTFDSEPIKIQIATCGGIEFLIQALETFVDNTTMLEETLLLIRNLGCYDDNKETIVALGCLPRVYECMKRHPNDATTQIKCTYLMDTLGRRKENKVIICNGALDLTLKAMENHPKHKDVIPKSLGMVIVVSRASENKKVIATKAIRPLMKVMTDNLSDARIQEQAFDLLKILANDDTCEAVVGKQFEDFSIMINSLEAHTADDDLYDMGIQAIYCFVFDPDNKARMRTQRDRLTPLLESAITQFPHKEGIQKWAPKLREALNATMNSTAAASFTSLPKSLEGDETDAAPS